MSDAKDGNGSKLGVRLSISIVAILAAAFYVGVTWNRLNELEAQVASAKVAADVQGQLAGQDSRIYTDGRVNVLIAKLDAIDARLTRIEAQLDRINR